MRRMREDHLHRNYSDVNERPIRCGAKLIQPKAGVAACLAMIPFARKKQPVQPQSQAMGAAREILGRWESCWALPSAGSFNRPQSGK